MRSTASKMASGIGIGLALGGAAALGAAMMNSPSMRKQTRKNAMKAMRTVSSMMDSVQGMMK